MEEQVGTLSQKGLPLTHGRENMSVSEVLFNTYQVAGTREIVLKGLQFREGY